MKYLITGATGLIGSAFLKSITEHDEAIILSSNISYAQKIYPEHQVIGTPQELNPETKIDVIINLAGSKIDRSWTQEVRKDLIKSRVDTTNKLLTIIKNLNEKPKVFISGSAIGYYGAGLNKEFTESSQPEMSFTHDLCYQWEDMANQAMDYGVTPCIMRLGVVLAKEGGFIKKIRLPFSLGLGGKLGSGKQIFSWIHINDVIAIIHFLISHPEIIGPVNCTAPDYPTNTELTKAIAKILHRPAFFHLPEFVVKTLFGKMGQELLLQGSKIIPERLIAHGYQFQYSNIYEALLEALQR